MSAEYFSFTVWKAALREDCEHEGKLVAFEVLGDSTLKLFWERGVEPTVQGVVKDGPLAAPKDASGSER